MKIRLIIPKCKNFNGWYCETSNDIDQRIEMLNQAMKEGDNIRLIITSHNFFTFHSNSSISAREFIIEKIIPILEEKIKSRKPLVFGFDFLRSSRTTKKQMSKKKVRRAFNPYGGISAVVCHIEVRNNSYIYKTHVWECWQDRDKCNTECFEKQNKSRIFSLGDKTIGLLSCGDIARNCHNDGELLPKVNVYVDLSHKSLRGWSSQNRIPTKLLKDWNKCDHVLIPQQVKDISTYLGDKKYPYIFPKNTPHGIKELFINGESRGVIIDVDIPRTCRTLS
jgi:hypothetical protein